MWSSGPACGLGIGAEGRNTSSRQGEVLTRAPLPAWLQLDLNFIATQKITFLNPPKYNSMSYIAFKKQHNHNAEA